MGPQYFALLKANLEKLTNSNTSQAEKERALGFLKHAFEHDIWRLTRKRQQNKRRGKQYIAAMQAMKSFQTEAGGLSTTISSAQRANLLTSLDEVSQALQDAAEA
jgi:hypothetical protein